MKTKLSHGGARPGAGRKSRKEKGLPPVKVTTVEVEETVIKLCREKYGSLANALRWAANQQAATTG